MPALTFEVVRNGTLVIIVLAGGLAVLLAWQITRMLAKLIAVALLGTVAVMTWAQRQEVQDCADQVRTTLTAGAVDDTTCTFLGRKVTVRSR